MKRYAILLFPALVVSFQSCAPRTPEPLTDANGPTAPADLVARGEYLVQVMGCHDCHTPKIMGPQGPVPDPDHILAGHLAGTPLPPKPANADGWVLMSMGVTAFVGPWGTSYAANLTSDDTGIGTWSEEQFMRALTKGLFKGLEGSRPMLPPMPWQNLANIDPADARAIFAYLKSTRPVENIVPNHEPPVGPS